MNNIMNIPLERFMSLRLSKGDKLDWEKQNISTFSLEQTFINSRECPHCSSHNVVSKGRYKERKRYQCRTCSKSFNDLTKTPFSGIHNLDKMKKYLNCIISGYSIRKAADIVGISITTSFFWRHKLLNALNRIPPTKMRNVKEAMELVIPYSHKGQRSKITSSKRNSKVSAVFVCDRMGKLDSDSIDYSYREKNPIFNRINETSNKHTEIICSPKFTNIIKSLNTYVKTTHSTYTKTKSVNQAVVVWQNWMKHFRGVATKYLTNYLHWFDYLDNTLINQNKIPALVQLLLKH